MMIQRSLRLRLASGNEPHAYSETEYWDDPLGRVKKVLAPGAGFKSMDRRFPGKLSGFVVTDQQGKTYYYTKPLFLLQQVSYINGTPTIPQTANKVFSLEHSGSHSYSTMNSPYATIWLLTSITGPDYIKINLQDDWTKEEKLRPHDGDIGYWVNFNYHYGDMLQQNADGSISKLDGSADLNADGKVTYPWRTPYFDSKTLPPLPHIYDPSARGGSGCYYSTFGKKEMTYLKSIETATEIAYFRTSERYDGLGVDEPSYPLFPPQPVIGWDTSKIAAEIEASNARVNFIPSVEGSSANLNNCFIIELDKNKYSKEKIDQLAEGASLLRVQVTATAHFKGAAPWRTKKYHTELAKGALIIVKDTYNCPKDANGNLISIAQEMDPARIYADYVEEQNQGDEKVIRAHYTSFAKCFYWKIVDNKIRLYITSFDCQSIVGFAETPETKIDMGRTWYAKEWNIWSLKRYTNFGIESIWTDGALGCYDPVNPVTRFQKKLDEIAWYSKAEYPCLSATADPEDKAQKEDVEKPAPYPASFRRVHFDYNYQNAPQTTNSQFSNGTMGNGRLTLKKLWFEGGEGANAIQMPPYSFEYQNSSMYYWGHDKVDPWGFRKTYPKDEQSSPVKKNDGIFWNISRINFPSGGSIEMSYERDYAVSGLTTLYDIHRNEIGNTPDEHVIFYNNPDYYYSKNVVSSNLSERSFVLDNTNSIQKGMYAILFSMESNPEPGQPTLSMTYHYIYRIEDVVNNTAIRLNKSPDKGMY